MTKQSNKPANTLRDGNLKAVIWANPSEKGVRYSVELVRSYKGENDEWHDTHYLSNGELLRGARLLGQAYDNILGLRAQQKAVGNNETE